MLSERLRRRLFPEELGFSRWMLMVRLYALVAGLTAGSIDLVLDVLHGHMGWEPVLVSAGIAVVVFLFVVGGLLASREVATNNARRMISSLEKSVIDGSIPNLPSLGWKLFDRGRDATIRLLTLRDEKIAALQHELDFYAPLAEDMPGLELVLDLTGRLLWINPAATTLTGFSREESRLAVDPVELWIYAKDRPTLREGMARVRQGEALEGLELRVQRKDGRTFWVICRCYPLRDASGKVSGLRFSAQDIQARKDTDLKLLETVAALRRAQALKEHYLDRSNDERMRLSALLEILSVGILFVDRDRRVVYINQRCADIWQLGERAAVVGMRDSALLAATAALRIDADAYHQHVEHVIANRSQGAQYDIHCCDGRVVREVSSIVPASDGGRAIGRVWIYEDITASLQAQERLAEMAERDPLTNLYNRRRFHEDLGRQLAESVRRNEHLGLLLFDLDGFKEINEAFGHHSGDEVLRRVASEISGVIRRNELLFRLGGEEFAILVTQPSVENLAHLTRRVSAQVAALEFCFEEVKARVAICAGSAMTPVNGYDAEALILAAEHAMRQARGKGLQSPRA
ncbi:diguanylate cyclase [Uliginosibacterium sp. 31-16]|uniref:sensor domain-containing diguanylate cyclase n=1 Tax=Uliginosibacterium sp. 31-16 TaxID=3068315 RepID=UPI00273F015A|nr:diguanylate cyclase [Uliginosibacterium sp. 31-16]MDP5238456.1 diguanylate cyclase [Uliginosibacterium sp. 31-16]